MDWVEEANSVIDEIRPFVTKVQLNPSSLWVQLDIETLESNILSVKLDESGFTVLEQTLDENDGTQKSHQTYESINALLSTVSPGYRKAFAEALISSLETCSSSNQLD